MLTNEWEEEWMHQPSDHHGLVLRCSKKMPRAGVHGAGRVGREPV
jgi:hypothetical protein